MVSSNSIIRSLEISCRLCQGLVSAIPGCRGARDPHGALYLCWSVHSTAGSLGLALGLSQRFYEGLWERATDSPSHKFWERFLYFDSHLTGKVLADTDWVLLQQGSGVVCSQPLGPQLCEADLKAQGSGKTVCIFIYKKKKKKCGLGFPPPKWCREKWKYLHVTEIFKEMQWIFWKLRFYFLGFLHVFVSVLSFYFAISL